MLVKAPAAWDASPFHLKWVKILLSVYCGLTGSALLRMVIPVIINHSMTLICKQNVRIGKDTYHWPDLEKNS
jgi:hypothetical protein